jgi:PST family polysaccharide transporter
VRVFQIIIGIIRNKVIAILLVHEGIGIIGILTSTVSLLQKGASLGVAQSAVRDVSEANALEDFSKYSRIISLTKQVVIFTGLLGCVLTIVISPLLSEWTFGNNSYMLAYLWLAIVVG